MYEAARVTDPIIHNAALTGFLAGAGLGIALIAGAAFATFTCGLGAGLLTGMVAGVGASSLLSLGEAAGGLFTDEAGKIATGSANVFINSLPAAFLASEIACEDHALVDHEAPALAPGEMPLAESPESVPSAGLPQIAEGSANVFINSRAAARVEDRTECDGVIGKGSRNVFIGTGRVSYRKVHSAVPESYRQAAAGSFTAAGLVGGLARLAGAATIKALLPCAVRFSAGYLAGDLFGRYLAAPTLQRVAGGLLGHPVEVSSGRKLLLAEDETDFVLPGPVPYAISRFYASNLEPGGALGRGWVLPWEVRLSRRDGKIWYSDAQGRDSGFPEVPPGHCVFHEAERLFLACTPDGRYLLHDLNDTTWDFGLALGQADQARLERLGDGRGHWLRFTWDADECCAIDTPVERLLLSHVDGRLRQIVRVAGTVSQTVARYGYDARGQLVQVTNANGELVRQFAYAQGVMVRHTNALGLECRYRWAEGRVREMETSLGERWHFDYGPGRTRVRDDLGREAEWQYDAEYRITACTDLDGGCYRLDYNPAGLPTVMHLPGERTIAVHYDKLGRPTVVIDPLGRRTETGYDRNSLRVTREHAPDATTTQAGYDELGRLTMTRDSLGRETRYDYPEQSPYPHTHTDARGGKQKLEWNARGQLLSHTDCSEKTTRYDYDDLGRLCSRTDALGQTTLYSWSLGGELLQVDHPGGVRECYSYDAAGLPSAHTDPAGQVWSWQRNARGQILHVLDPAGRVLDYRYDSHGRLVALQRGHAAYRFAYDAGDRLRKEVRPDGIERHFVYDSRGFLSGLGWHGLGEETAYAFEHDALGRLLRKSTASAETRYTYDAGDRLTVAERHPTPQGEALGIKPNTVSFRYDQAGRLVAEEGVNGQIGYTYGLLDELLRLELPQQPATEWLHYGSGHVHQIRCGTQVITDIERDDMHREVLRSQGRLIHRQGFDALGRRTWQSAGSHPPSVRPGQGRYWRTYVYSPAGELAERDDSLRGRTRYRYDAAGHLLGCTAQREAPETFAWDAAGNLLEDSQRGGTVAGNRLLVWQDRRFSYDGFGNLKSKRQGRHQVQHFSYDAEHQLLAVRIEAHGRQRETRFDYDALGRRIALTETAPYMADDVPVLTTRRFLWQGLRLVQERTEQRLSQYLYSPDDPYAPLARLDTLTEPSRGSRETHCWHYHTDVLGTPQALTDSDGDLLWAGRYQAWGKVIADDHAGAALEQPLRLAGQYADRSTGLHYNTFRYYDPDIGRYISQDPIGLLGGDNLYAYAPNPTGWVDPWGLAGIKWVDPNTVNFTQRTIAANNYAELMRTGQWDWNRQGSSIRVMDVDGQLVAYDNRRLEAALEVGTKRVSTEQVFPDDAFPGSTTGKTWSKKFSERLADRRNKKAGGTLPPQGTRTRPIVKGGCGT